MTDFKKYLVGGYVRDLLISRLHGTPIFSNDRDWVVTGTTPDIMLSDGYRAVGADFPVFLHPQTHEEYALARTEKRAGRGHTGFNVFFSPDVTLEEDLARRDLTINAIAMDGEQIIDPYDGMSDVQSRTLRHVTASFSEDPLRVLRVARFYARFNDFTVANETMQLMRDMVSAGELEDLTVERIWKETEKALLSEHPSRFFTLLNQCGALKVIFPELAALHGVPQTAKHHPEIDTLVHTMMVVDQSAKLGGSLAVRAAALLHDLGKALSPEDMLPRHIGHESTGVPLVQEFCDRLRVPGYVKELAIAVTRYHLQCHRCLEMRPAKIVDLLSSIGAFRIQNRIDDFIMTCKSDALGRKGFESTEYQQGDFLKQAFQAAQEVKGRFFIDQGHNPGPELGGLIREERIRRISTVKQRDFPK